MFSYDSEMIPTQESNHTPRYKSSSTMRNNFDPSKVRKIYRNQELPELDGDKLFEDPIFNKENFLSQNQIENKTKSEEIEYKSADEIFGGNYLVFEDKIESADVKNSQFSNNYFLSVLASITQYPVLIYNLFKSKEVSLNGLYEVIMFIEGEWQVVILDSYFPVKRGTNELYFTRTNSNELWVLLLEKAWSKVNGGYFSKTTPSDAFLALTGFQCETILNKQKKEEVWSKISQNKYNLLCTGSNTTNKKFVESYGLVSEHSYMILSAKKATLEGESIRLVKLRNPWGLKGWNGVWSENSHRWTKERRKLFDFTEEDKQIGNFYMDFDDFCNYFSSTCICYFQSNSYFKSFHLNPEQFNLKHPLVFNFTLNESLITGLSLFNQSKQQKKLSVSLIYSRLENGNLVDVEGNFSGDNINVIKKLPKGQYVVWIFMNRDSENNEGLIFRISSQSDFQCQFVGFDLEFRMAKSLILAGVNSDEKINKEDELYFKSKTEFKNTGIGYFVFENFSEKKSYINKFDFSHTSNMKILNQTEFEKILHPKSKLIILAIRENFCERSSFYLEFKTSQINSEPANEKQNELNFHDFISEFDEKLENHQYDYYLNDFRADFELRFDKLQISENIFYKLKSEFPLQFEEILKVDSLQDGIKCFWSDRQDFDNGYFLGEVNADGERHGRGFYHWFTGDIYIGQWQKAERTGTGKTYDKQGRLIYEGDYLKGKRHGTGVLYLENGDSYKGEFKNDLFNGAGTYFWHENISWSGTFVDDKLHGIGIFVFENGKSKLREFNMGEIVK